MLVLLIVIRLNKIITDNQIESSGVVHRRRLFRFCRLHGRPWWRMYETPSPPGKSSRYYL